MKIDRQKKARKWMTHYKMTYGYCEPYKVLLDPLLLRYALETRVFLREFVPKALQCKVAHPVITQCVYNWMKTKGGEAYSGAVVACKRMERLNCEHSPCLSPHDCLLSLLKKEIAENPVVPIRSTAKTVKTKAVVAAVPKGKRKFCVAAQDRKIRLDVQSLASVPLVCFVTKPVPKSQQGVFNPSIIGALTLVKPGKDKKLIPLRVHEKIRENRMLQRKAGKDNGYLDLKIRLGLVPMPEGYLEKLKKMKEEREKDPFTDDDDDDENEEEEEEEEEEKEEEEEEEEEKCSEEKENEEEGEEEEDDEKMEEDGDDDDDDDDE